MIGGGDDDIDDPHDAAGAPVDFDRLDVLDERLGTDTRFERTIRDPEYAPERLICIYSPRFYPEAVETARLECVWFENGDFSLHYHEQYPDDTFDHRWDRHPSSHNDRDHVHPGPDAPTPGIDASHPPDWRDVVALVLGEIEERQRAFWID